MRHTIRSFVAVATLGAVLTACTSDTDEPGTDSEARGTASTGGSQDGKAESVSFGGAAEYDNGVSVTVAEPERFNPSKKAQAGGEPEFVVFEVSILNDSPKAIAPRQLSFTVESAGQQAGQVLDPKKGITGPPRQRVAPGDDVAWEVAFGVIDPSDVTVEVQLGLDTDPVVVSAGK